MRDVIDMRQCACCECYVQHGDIVWPKEAENHWWWFTCGDCARDGREPKEWKDAFVRYYTGEEIKTGEGVDRFCDVLRSFGRVDNAGVLVDNVASVGPATS